MSSSIKESLKVDSFLIFYLIHTAQVGVGILSFQRHILKTARFDAWMTVLLTGLLFHGLIWLIYQVLKKGNGDLTDIHQQLFGTWFGRFFSTFFMLYLFLAAIMVLRNYIEIIQVWMFPHVSTWLLALMFSLLIFYIVSGGFKTVTGISFISFIITLPILYFLVYPLEFAHFGNFLPIFRISVTDLLLSTKDMIITFLGIELLLIYYPFIKKGEKSQKWAHAGMLLTTVVYLAITIVSFAFYSEEQLKRTIWPTLSLFKVAKLPFVERFEYFGISLWLLVIITNLVLYTWAASRIGKKVFKISQRKMLCLSVVLLIVASMFIEGREMVNQLTSITSYIGMAILIIYVPFLFIYQACWMKLKERKESEDE